MAATPRLDNTPRATRTDAPCDATAQPDRKPRDYTSRRPPLRDFLTGSLGPDYRSSLSRAYPLRLTGIFVPFCRMAMRLSFA